MDLLRLRDQLRDPSRIRDGADVLERVTAAVAREDVDLEIDGIRANDCRRKGEANAELLEFDGERAVGRTGAGQAGIGACGRRPCHGERGGTRAEDDGAPRPTQSPLDFSIHENIE